MSTTEIIYQKYWNALVGVEAVMVPADTAIALALRLAIDEAIATHPVALKQPSTADRVVEWQQMQISRLNDWLQVHEPGIYLSPGDTADAILAALGNRDQRIAELDADLEKLQTDVDAECADLQEDLTSARQELAPLIEERDSLRQRLAQMEADNSLSHSNGNGTSAGEPDADAPTWWAFLDAETNDWRISLEAKRRRFGEIPKPQRLLLAQAFARHIGEGLIPTQSAFNAHKPEWMPMANGIVQGIGVTWAELLRVMPSEVPA